MNSIGKQLLDIGEKAHQLGLQLNREQGIYKRGYLDALNDVLNLPVKDFNGDFMEQVYKIKKELEGKE